MKRFIVVVILTWLMLQSLAVLAHGQEVGHITLLYVNEAREARGLDPLVYSSALEDVAEWYNKALIERGTFDHGQYTQEEQAEFILERTSYYGETFMLFEATHYQDLLFQQENTTQLLPPSELARVFNHSPAHAEALYRPSAMYIGIDHRQGYNRVIATFVIAMHNKER